MKLGQAADLKNEAWDACVKLMNTNIGNRAGNVFKDFQALRALNQQEIGQLKDEPSSPKAANLLNSLCKLDSRHKKIMEELSMKIHKMIDSGEKVFLKQKEIYETQDREDQEQESDHELESRL